MISQLSSIFNTLINFAFPSFCAECHILLSREEILCNSCAASLSQVCSSNLLISKKKSLTVHALTHYSGITKTLVLRKNQGQSKTFEKLARLTLKNLSPEIKDVDYFIPIPIHWTKKLQRGFNQTEILAKTYADLSGAQMLSCLIKKVRTKPQTQLSKEERQINIKGSFSVDEKYKELLFNKKIILVDDVMTTGATLTEAARVLSNHQPKIITAIVVCR
ncbi:ComF family protein [Candidatus Dependentiae bacterium]|nr:ComF family protein [Candidatus Dependentiae bacterium]